MKLYKTEFDGLYIIDLITHSDSRGDFTETFKKDWLSQQIGYKIDFCQDNSVESKHMVLRGLHFQKNPFSQTKMVTVVVGKILDVVVDLRKESKSYGKYFCIELNSNEKKSLLIPKGFAHGYLTLTEKAVVNYKVDNYYNKDSERGIRFNDPFLNINWKYNFSEFIISEKDKNYKDFIW